MPTAMMMPATTINPVTQTVINKFLAQMSIIFEALSVVIPNNFFNKSNSFNNS